MMPFLPLTIYQTSKCYTTHGKMGHLDPKQLPSKNKPWTTFANQDFIHRADLIIPQEVLEMVQEAIMDKPTPQYKRVVMSLADIIEPEFLGKYVKSGSIIMLSEGKMGTDNVFTLRQGILTIYLDKAAYEQTGIIGKTHGAKGDRGLKPRWVIEVDLNSGSMSPGKKGFNRLVYAAENVFNQPLRWLFYNLGDSTPTPDPLDKHSPATFTIERTMFQDINALVPDLKIAIDPSMPKSRAKEEFEDTATELYEWLSLVRLESPRIQARDRINPYLCRYQVPGSLEGSDTTKEQELCKISWQGFLPPSWARQTLVDIIAALPAKTWFSFSTTTFSKGLSGDNAECTMLRLPDSGGEYLLWEVKSHE